MMSNSLFFKKTDNRAISPVRAHSHDAGIDLFALEDVVIYPGEIQKIRTGIHVALPITQTGLYWGKSGRASNGLAILGGCIDGPYRGELFVVVTNVNTGTLFKSMILQESHDKFVQIYEANKITIPYGKALTQLLTPGWVCYPHELPGNYWDQIHSDTERGDKGFGSSDNKTSDEDKGMEFYPFSGGPLDGKIPVTNQLLIIQDGAIYHLDLAAKKYIYKGQDK